MKSREEYLAENHTLPAGQWPTPTTDVGDPDMHDIEPGDDRELFGLDDDD